MGRVSIFFKKFVAFDDIFVKTNLIKVQHQKGRDATQLKAGTRTGKIPGAFRIAHGQ